MKVKVNTKSKTYYVHIEKDFEKSLESFIRKYFPESKLFVVADSKIIALFKDRISLLQQSFGGKKNLYKFVAKEENKNYLEVQKIQAKLLKAGYGRDTLLIAIGGGITGDIAGFAASTYMRGIPFVQVPTTILAAVDSSVGGKTGINFSEGKNIIGSFWQPEAVFVAESFFETLPERELISGFGEILKYAYLSEKRFFNFVSKSFSKYLQKNEKVLTKLIAESVKIKASVVAEDENEKGLRRILNLGHTFGHALEVEQSHKIKHGEAVIVGLLSALELSRLNGLLTSEKFEELEKPFLKFKDKIKLRKPNPVDVYRLMSKDKKKLKGKLRFVLLGDVGMIYPEVVTPKKQIIKSMEYAFEYFN